MNTLISYLKLAVAYMQINFKSLIAYRGAFISQMVAMFINDFVWIAFWSLFFTRFPVVKGWGVNDVITLWAIAASGFGFAHMIMGNALALPGIIVRGELDTWLLYPRAVLPHLLLGKSNATSWGDALFGIFVYVIFVKPDLPHLLLFLTLLCSVSILFVGFSVLTGSLAFYIGSAESVATQLRFAMITFSTYPSPIFQGFVKVLLFTLVPAMFVSHLPVSALRNMSLSDTLYSFGGAFAILFAGVLVFYAGLKRYESGNLIEMRG
ncbi:MAG: ABC-2 family transporter protein [Leptolyngbya sp.]|nr:ABC-2 family transporter protein [Candidatus Melainabacteria bacterium]